jgi:hypothetical protein
MQVQHFVYRELLPVNGFRGSTGVALGSDGRPMPPCKDFQTASKIADRMNRENRRIGSDYCTNLVYFPATRLAK